jgi:hypothetical protein
MGEGLGKSGRLALVGDSPYTYVSMLAYSKYIRLIASNLGNAY